MNLFDNFNFDKLKSSLSKTRDKLVNSINETVTGRAIVDDKTLDEIEEILITSDIGYDLSMRIIDRARYYHRLEKDRASMTILDTVKKELIKVIDIKKDENADAGLAGKKPYIVLIVGVNGAGKTTSIGKLAHNYKKAGMKVIVGAADTFRAAANEQLEIWAKRAGVEIVSKGTGADPSSVAFETIQKAIKGDYDVVLIDTAGRLHNKTNLMEELNKIKRSVNKVLPGAPHQTLLVLDGNTGQNALVQADEFAKVTDINGLIITKLDGTAKGGVVFQIVTNQSIPVKYIGVGEGIDDLQTFDPKMYVDAIFE